MLLSSTYRIPYVDPAGYDIVSPSDLEVLAERVDSVLTGFDVRTTALFKRPYQVWGRTGTGGSGGPDSYYFLGNDKLLQDNTNGGISQSSGDKFTINPAVLNPDCYVLCGMYTPLYPTSGNGNVGYYLRQSFRIRDVGHAYATKDVALYWDTRYWTGTGVEDCNTMMLLRLRPGQEINYLWSHGLPGGAYVASYARSWITYLMAAT